MISNSHLSAPTIAFGSRTAPSTKVADTYSDNLMDDLFLDVDQILEGDLSSHMTVVGHQPKPINPANQTVQLPSNFAPRSAADLYRATVEARNRQLADQPSTRAIGYSGGGRPVTTVRRTPAHSGNFQSAVIQSPSNLGLYAEPVNSRWPSQSEAIQPVSNNLYPDQSLPALMLSNVSARPPQTIFEPQVKPPQPSVSLPFLLVGAAGISAVSSLGLWALSQSAPNNGWLISLNREASAAELPDHSTEDFLAYLQRSLDVISARELPNGQTVSVIPVANASQTLPTTVPNVNPAAQVGVLPNLPGAIPPPNVIERVFVPVYQHNQATQKAAAQPAPSVPNVAVPSSKAKRPTVPVPAPVAAAAAIPPGAPSAAKPSVPIVPVGASSLPTPPSVPIAVAPTNAAAPLTDITPASEHALVGILNLGSRSAALFNIDGSSQRAYVGDRIGVSKWTLVSVNGQDVVVRRDGEVRSIYIGQRF